ncbi:MULTISPECIES: VanZ family protein [Microbacterium]|uniref:VanZ family protein n=1 Tax=Microbacterium wangchenii TaxID=2541726 RepID=A0ABX5ST13_9MICO|nr:MULTISPECIES: VanZ family protein [Microbacterium]MCK6064924.1 VanZ family protein [Microbacterium sp. EYE_512]QBR88405.1 VanZ family protein [Microbacterium wangchenii]
MRDQLVLALLAVLIGGIVGFLLFVPFVAASYRRGGRLPLSRLAMWSAALVYFWAIWTYTLLPLPDPDTMVCAGVNLNPAQFVADILEAISAPGAFLTNPAVLQLLLNVALFVPLGCFVRVLGQRGVVVSAVLGLSISAIVEFTQLTGVWGLYPCAYRVFDVDDLLTNTIGAVIGSLLALALPRAMRAGVASTSAAPGGEVTRGRRIYAMVSDLVAALIIQGSTGILVQLWLQFVVQDRSAVIAGTIAGVTGTLAAIIGTLAVVMATGRTIGDIAVGVRFAGGPGDEWVARLMRYLGGIGGYLLLSALPGGWGGLAFVFAVLSLVLVFTRVGPGGLPGLLARRRLSDARRGASRPR